MYDTLIAHPLTQSQRRCMQLSWLYFCGIYARKCGWTQLFKLQPSVNLHAQLQPLCSAAVVPNLPPRRDEGLGSPVQWSNPYSILAPTQPPCTSNRAWFLQSLWLCSPFHIDWKDNSFSYIPSIVHNWLVVSGRISQLTAALYQV